MAVENKYVNTRVEAGKNDEAPYVSGSRVIGMVETEEVHADDGVVSVYRFFKGLTPNLIPIRIRIYVDDAIAGATEADVGLYEQTDDGGTGAVIDRDCFADNLDLVALGAGGIAIHGGAADAGAAASDGAIDGMAAVDIANKKYKLYQHAGHDVTDYTQGYDLCLTVVSDTTTTGTVTIVATFLEG